MTVGSWLRAAVLLQNDGRQRFPSLTALEAAHAPFAKPQKEYHRCATHAARLQRAKDSDNIASELLAEITTLDNAVAINAVLSRLFTMLAEGRITARRTAVLTYLANLLLHTLPAMDRELHPDLPPPRN